MASISNAVRSFARGAYRLGSARLTTRFPGQAARDQREMSGFVPGSQSGPAFALKFAGALMNYHALQGRQAQEDRLRSQVLEENELRLQALRAANADPNQGLVAYTPRGAGAQTVALTPGEYATRMDVTNAPPPAARRIALPPAMARSLSLTPGADNLFDENEVSRALTYRGQNMTQARFGQTLTTSHARLLTGLIARHAAEEAGTEFQSKWSGQLMRLTAAARAGDASAAKMLGITDTKESYLSSADSATMPKTYKGARGETAWDQLVNDRSAATSKAWQAGLLRQAQARYSDLQQNLIDFARGYGEGGPLDRGYAPRGDEMDSGGSTWNDAGPTPPPQLSPTGQALADSLAAHLPPAPGKP